jgi:uncharacterized protein (TIGR00369 family)
MDQAAGDGPEAEALRASIAASPFHTGLGLRIDAASRGTVELSMDVTSDRLNLQGSVHGGVLATLADTAMGLAVRTEVGPDRPHATVEMSIRYLRASRPGRIEATGHTQRVGSTLAFAEADVRDADGRSLARASGIYAVGTRDAQ